MQHTTKMVMVPQDAYSSLMSQQKQLYSPVVNQLSNLDQELQAILTNPSLSADVKYHQYMNVFNRYQSLRHQQIQQSLPPPPPPPAPRQQRPDVDDLPPSPLIRPELAERIVNELPKQVRRKGQLLLEHMKDDRQRFNFLPSGELIAEGEAIPGSNVMDLIHYATRKRPTVQPPPGFDEFQELLHESNVPREAHNLQPEPLSPAFASADESPTFSGASTPKAAKKNRPVKQAVRQLPLFKPDGRPVRNVKQPDKLGTWLKF